MIIIDVLSIPGCNDTPPTIELIQNIANQHDIDITFTHKVINSPDEADKFKLIGSPTVLINGIDIEPEMRNFKQYGFT